ncbi:hypothetical protein GOP47_0002426 [Adiantum capillus-veneris]|uniref:X8 domain-containing protein n=1 Tax=Adiantum capillus-veneris TaxID=13818 RepID=A0A9D4VBQ7_ADICA|nr:hypothetical protein GOP47_0002426 [Adiantum capillus-veneris]
MLGEVVCGRETLDVGGSAIEGRRISLSSTYDKSWCIAKDYAKPDPVQEGLNWACGFGGADCVPIQLGNGCYLPNTVYSHASYAFNSYYQIHQHASGTCDFDGVATVTYEDPSYSGCTYPFRVGETGAESNGTRRFCFVKRWQRNFAGLSAALSIHQIDKDIVIATYIDHGLP